MDYSKDVPPINIITDASASGIGGIVSQGHNWKDSKIVVFYSAKLNSAQQNYPVHDVELLAGVKTMLRHKNLLQGMHFFWYTNHRVLEHILKQPALSGRQARWLEKISDFDFTVKYILGTTNILADTLSCIYSGDLPGTICSKPEYTLELNNDDLPRMNQLLSTITQPLEVQNTLYIEARLAAITRKLLTDSIVS